MSSTDATGIAVTAAQLETLRVAQLGQTAESLDRAAGEMRSRSVSAEVSDPFGDVAASIRTVRADLDALDALDALGYRDRECDDLDAVGAFLTDDDERGS